MWNSLLERLTPAAIRARGPDDVRRARLVVGASLTVLVWGPFYYAVYAILGPQEALGIVAAATIGCIVTPGVLWLTRSSALAGNWLTWWLYVSVVGCAYLTGGAEAPALLWSIGVPMLALAIVGPRATVFWVVAVVAAQAAFYVMPRVGLDPWPAPAHRNELWLLALSGLTLMLLSVAFVYGKQAMVNLQEANDRLIEEIRQHRATQSRLRKAEQLEALGRVVASVGHEINNPLTYTLTNLQLATEELARPGIDAERRRSLAEPLTDARMGAERIRDVVRHIHVFSRRDDNLGPVDVAEVISQALRLVANEARHHARLVTKISDVPKVRADTADLGRLFVNLLMNAIDAVPVGKSDRNEIRVTVGRAASGEVLVRVGDTGTGIPEELLERIFEPFYTTKEPGRGTGLGLAICHELATRFGGRLEVQSEVGVGSVFSVYLPVAETETCDAKRPASDRPSGLDTGHPRRRVLVIDDDAVLRRTVRRLLRMHEVVTVGTAAEALEACREGNFDAVLCDLMMPDATGMEIHARVHRERPALADRFLFMTGGAIGPEAIAFCMSMHARVVQKPFQFEKLLERIEWAAEGRVSALVASSLPPPVDLAATATPP